MNSDDWCGEYLGDLNGRVLVAFLQKYLTNMNVHHNSLPRLSELSYTASDNGGKVGVKDSTFSV